MLGTFENYQPKIEIEVKGVGGVSKKFMGIIDSGFNGYLTMSYFDAFPIGLVLNGLQENILADGSSTSNFVCVGQVCIDGKCITTTIEIQPSEIVLIGTKLLKELGKIFVLDCNKGIVEIKDTL